MRHRTRTIALRATAAFGFAILFACGNRDENLAGAEEPVTQAPHGDALPPHLRALQQRLGGSVVDQFDSLTVPAASQEPAVSAPAQPKAITALREVAARLDIAANRLEMLELYSQADSLRQTAQQLRLDARRMSTASAAPTPSGVILPYPSTTASPWQSGSMTPTPATPMLHPTGGAGEPADPAVWTEDRGPAETPAPSNPAITPTPVPSLQQ